MFLYIVTCIAIIIISQEFTNISGDSSETVNSLKSPGFRNGDLLKYFKPTDIGSYEKSPSKNEVSQTLRKVDNQLRSKLSSSSSPREGRLLLKLAARKLPGLILGAGILAGSAGTGTLSSTNSFNLFGKTINSALSLAYGDRGLVPPFVVPTYPVGGGLPIAPVGGGLPIAPVGGGLPLAPVGPGGPILPLPARAAVKTAEQSVPEQTKITTVNSVQRTEQIEGSIPNILDQYMQIERLREKLLIEPKKSVNDPVASNVNIVTESVSQKLLTDQLPTFSSQIRTDQTLTQLDERLKQFLKQHNDLVDELNNRMYVKVPTVKQF